MPKAPHAGFQLAKEHGQHLLANTGVVHTIVEKAGIRPSDVVLEIGPGTGNLTIALLEKAKHVYAIEIDPRMVSELRKRVALLPELREKLTIIPGDFTRMPIEKIPRFDMCVSNCPYNISSAIVFRLLEFDPPPRKHVLMFQLEFAQGLAAEPGQEQYSRLTVNTRLLSRTKVLMRVSRNSFKPPPKVDSAVIEIIPTGAPQGLNLQEFNGLTRVLFTRKNKTLASIFKTKSLLEELCKNASVLEEFAAMNQVLDSSKAMKGPYAAVNQVLQASGGAVDLPVSGQTQDSPLTPDQIQQRISKALASLDMAEMRPAKMTVTDFLALLNALAERGVRFS